MRNDKVTIITDGGSESGIAIAKRLLEDGGRVVLNNAPGSPLAAAFPETTACVACDLTTYAGGDALADFARGRFGGADLLVCNDDHVTLSPLETISDEDFDRALKLNTKTAFTATRSVGALMARAGAGAILYISSIHDEKASGCAFAYSMAKSAVLMLMREAALEFGPQGVRVNLIELGAVSGDEDRFSPELSRLYDRMATMVPSDTPVGYGDLVDFVARYAEAPNLSLHGANIRMDGGFTLYYVGREA